MKKIALALLALLLASPVLAQNDAPAKVEQPWFMLNKLSSPISVAATTSASALPSGGLILWACNTGSNDAYLSFGRSNTISVTIATGTWLKAATCAAYDLFPIGASTPYTYVATIGSGGVTTVYVETGIGQPPAALAGGGGGGGSVTQGTSPWTDQGAGASGTALAGNPFRVGLSDGTNNQNWLAAIALGDGVNGNNTGAVAPWWWNGTTWDRTSPMGLKTDPAAGTGTVGLVALLKQIHLDATAAIPGLSGSAQSSSNPMGWVVSQVSTNNANVTPHVCGSRAFITFTTGTDLSIVPGVAAQNVYVCDYSISFSGAGAVYLESTTTASTTKGSACSATLAAIDLTWTGVVGGGEKGTKTTYSGLSTGAGNGLCLNAGTGAAGSISVAYDQY